MQNIMEVFRMLFIFVAEVVDLVWTAIEINRFLCVEYQACFLSFVECLGET